MISLALDEGHVDLLGRSICIAEGLAHVQAPPVTRDEMSDLVGHALTDAEWERVKASDGWTAVEE